MRCPKYSYLLIFENVWGKPTTIWIDVTGIMLVHRRKYY